MIESLSEFFVLGLFWGQSARLLSRNFYHTAAVNFTVMLQQELQLRERESQLRQQRGLPWNLSGLPLDPPLFRWEAAVDPPATSVSRQILR